MDKNRAVESDISTILHMKARQAGVPVSGTFELTSRCNFNCKMCYVHSAECNCADNDIPADWWINLGEAAVKKGLVFLLLTGGEPLCRADFSKIYTSLKDMGLVMSLNTNGYLLDGEIAELFRKNPPSRINVSLYGTSEETYERFTGVRGFEKVISNIERMRSYGIDMRLNCSITPDNRDDMEEIFRLSRELDLHIKATPYMYPRTRVDSVHGKNSGRLSAQDAAACRVCWSKMKYSPEEFISRARGMQNGIDSFDCSGEEVCGGKVRCRAGSSSFWVNKDGGMMPCGLINKAFDINTLGFEKAWESVREFTSSIVLPQTCQTCKYQHFCNVCAAVCFTETGDFSKVPEYVCRFSEATAKITRTELERLEKLYGN